MSNDRHNDEKVSETYKSLADERTPQHLDQKILQMAGAEVRRPLYSRWIRWTRPLAWAATITLCLAVTLELLREPSLESQLPMPADDAAEFKSPASVSAPQLQKRELDSNVRADSDQVFEAEPRREQAATIAESIISEKTALGRSAAKQPANEPAPAARMRLTDDAAAVKDQEEKVKVAAYESALVADTGMPDADECSDEVRVEAERWLECIVKLEESGNDAAAERQRNALKETFPDFKMP
jgi:hypothetical protein